VHHHGRDSPEETEFSVTETPYIVKPLAADASSASFCYEGRQIMKEGL
jgi:hypothetical protein